MCDPPVVHTSKQSPQFVTHQELVGATGSIIMALPAAVNFVLVQKVVGLGSVPHPQDPLVRSLYLVVEAQGFPSYIGGQPSHFDNTGVDKLSQVEAVGDRKHLWSMSTSYHQKMK